MDFDKFYDRDKISSWIRSSNGELEIPVINVKSLSEYVDLVCFITEIWRSYPLNKKRKTFPGERAPWFRGVRDHSYELEPRLLREKEQHKFIKKFGSINNNLSKVEKYMKTRFVSGIRPLKGRSDNFDINNLSNVDVMIMMQHYGLPTRLLDWSKNALTGLYFSVKGNYEGRNDCYNGKDCSVWMLNPRNLANNERIVDAIDPEDIKIIDNYLSVNDVEGDASKYPLPIIPSPIDLRVTTQHSRFTLHRVAGGIEKAFAISSTRENGYWSIIKVQVPEKYKSIIHRDLRLFGTTEMDILPCVETLASEINDRMTFGMIDIDRFISESES